MPFRDGTPTLEEKGPQDFLKGIRWECLHHSGHFVSPCKQKQGKRRGCAQCIKTCPSQTRTHIQENRHVRRDAGLLADSEWIKLLGSLFRQEFFKRLPQVPRRDYSWLIGAPFRGLTQICPDCGFAFGRGKRCGICRIEWRYEVHDRHHDIQDRCKKYDGFYAAFNLRSVLERDNWTCRWCRVSTPEVKRGTYDDDAPEVDHIWPLAATKDGKKGPGHVPENCCCSCRKCNLKRSNKVIGDFVQI